MAVFLMDFGAERFVEKRYGIAHGPTEGAAGERHASVDAAMLRYSLSHTPSNVADHRGHQHLHSGDQDNVNPRQPAHRSAGQDPKALEAGVNTESSSLDLEKEAAIDRSFKQQIAAFLILEFGVIFHSVVSHG